MKKIILYFLFFFFSVCFNGCSLFSSNENRIQTPENTENEEFSDNDIEDSSDALSDSPVEMDPYEDKNMATEENFMEGKIDEYSDDKYADNGDQGSGLPSDPMTDNKEEDLFARQEPSSSDPSGADNDLSYDYVDSVNDKPKFVPVKKMKSSAYERSGANINCLYVVRSGDDMQSIAVKIYGEDRSRELYSYNPHFEGKALNVGDKIYYQSPNNPGDSVMKTYYEDNNLQPQYYVTREGDNLRKFSKDLLGHNRSWMEIYATNENVKSKGRLPANLQIRYWPESSNIKVAENSGSSEEVKSEPMIPVENQDVAVDQDQQPQSEDFSQETPPDVMEEPIAQVGDTKNFNDSQIDNQNPPPPTPAEINNQPSIEPVEPPPPPSTQEPKISEKSAKNFTEDEKLMAALCGLMLLVAIILLILIRRNRSRKVNFGHTQS